LKVKREQLT